ncbi:MAG: glycosyltransferase [Candidatus Krumholzibacteriia bacterium]
MSAERKPRVLLIKPVLPFPPNQGTKVASFGLIKALQRDFDVTVLARILGAEENEPARELERWCARVVTVMAPNRRSALHRVFYKLYYYLVSILTRRSLKGLYDCPRPFLRAARELSREGFDLVIVEYWQLRAMLDLFPREKCILLTHDIDMLVNRKISLLERNLMRKLQAVRRWLLEQKEEVRAYRAAAHVWALTERDKLAVESLCRDDTTVEVMPFGLDVDFLLPSGMARNPGEVLFLGHMGALFNRDALDYFVRKIHPLMDELEGLSITIVGGNLPKELEFFALQPEVEVVGTVADVRPYLHRAACLVIPLRFGGGLRIRILEAMSAGVPIVCSAAAIAGMPFEAGREFLVAETPAEYAAQVGRVLADGETGARLSEAALAKVRSAYGVEAQAARVVEMVRHRITAS